MVAKHASRNSAEFKEKNRVYQNAWYHANKESARKSRKERSARLTAAVREYKQGRGCEKCGETHFACLEFHHPDPSKKDINPQDIVQAKGWSIDRILVELRTMQVLCANCHRKLHHEWFLATGSRTKPPKID